MNDVVRFAGKFALIPRVGLTRLPTPLEPLKRLSAHLGGPRLWVKREDCTGFGFGGNKLRKLDHVLTEAHEADTLVSGGVVQSNSQRQVAAAAAKLGLDCHLVVYHGRLQPPSDVYEKTGNVALNKLFGATLHDLPWTGDRNHAIEDLAARLTQEGRKPYVVPYGVSNGLGAVGYASTALEIAQQSAEAGFAPSAIVHCSGSGATQAGLAVGAAACLPDCRVVGIDIDAEPARVRSDVIQYARAAAAFLDEPFDEKCIDVVAGHAGPAYGVPHQATIDAIKLMGRLEALVLDPVYSGKGLAGLIALIEEGRWTQEDDVVFVHTGGEPALFAYLDGMN
ncbi:MAG: pyridoxal-phosphate dependent enzyme [Alphaproteobacteria bacterium]|nr:pyridoxal-phosphate dependent enzyme [Alphaproteobacteria bacterium]